MSGVDSPQSEDNLSEHQTGISAFDFEDLTPSALTITRTILRHRELTYAGLCNALAALPVDERLTGAEIDAALALLLQANQVIPVHEAQPPRYKVNLRRKQVSTLRRGIWEALDTPEAGGDSRRQERARRQGRVQNVWANLDNPAPRHRLPDFSIQPAPPATSQPDDPSVDSPIPDQADQEQ